jgi:hypothetical protein
MSGRGHGADCLEGVVGQGPPGVDAGVEQVLVGGVGAVAQEAALACSEALDRIRLREYGGRNIGVTFSGVSKPLE